MKGLWSDFFPSAEKTRPAPLPPRQKCFICPSCNDAVCRLLTSGTAENPGRKFYKCPGTDHKFFKWADEVKPDELIDVPNCGGCSAGVCRVRREKTGRILFMCRVKKGEGSCGYEAWQDELEMSLKAQLDEGVTSTQLTMTNCDEIGSANVNERLTSESTVINCNEIGSTHTDVVEETGHERLNSGLTMTNCNEIGSMHTDVDEETRLGDGMVDNESQVHCGCLGVTCAKMEQIKCKDKICDESSRRQLKRSRCGNLKGMSTSANSLKLRQSANSMSITHHWLKAAIEQNLGTQLQGWWGRLAFHPMPCLTTHASTSFTFHVSSQLDSIFRAKDKNPLNSSDSSVLTTTLPGPESYRNPPFNPTHNAELPITKPFHVALNLPSSSKSFHETGTDNVMSESISKVFSQAAELLQNDLVALLETTDIRDHEAMTRAAESIFAALDHLLFNHQDFKKSVEELIHCSRSLAKIEQSMPTSDSYKQLVDRFSSERTRLDKFNQLHAKSVNDVMNNKRHLKELQEEVDSAMDWIFHIKAELSCFELEMRTMEEQLEQISENKEVLERQYLIMSEELEESRKFYERKEAERSAAKAAFDRAKASLRG